MKVKWVSSLLAHSISNIHQAYVYSLACTVGDLTVKVKKKDIGTTELNRLIIYNARGYVGKMRGYLVW